jgi:hypothetical protein
MPSSNKIKNTVTILAEPDEISNFIKNTKNLSCLMEDKNEKTDTFQQMDIEVLEDRLGQDIAWQCYENGDVKRSGLFSFGSSSKGTVVRLFLDADDSKGKFLGNIFGIDAETFVLTTLRRLKAYMETGEIPTTEGQPTGKENPEEGDSYARTMLGR